MKLRSFLRCLFGTFPPKDLVGILRWLFVGICGLLLIGAVPLFFLGSWFVDLQPSTIAGWFLAAAGVVLVLCLVTVILKGLYEFLCFRPVPLFIFIIYVLIILILVVLFLSLIPNAAVPPVSDLIEKFLGWLNFGWQSW